MASGRAASRLCLIQEDELTLCFNQLSRKGVEDIFFQFSLGMRMK